MRVCVCVCVCVCWLCSYQLNLKDSVQLLARTSLCMVAYVCWHVY